MDNIMFENPFLVERFLNYWRKTGKQVGRYLPSTYLRRTSFNIFSAEHVNSTSDYFVIYSEWGIYMVVMNITKMFRWELEQLFRLYTNHHR